LSKLADKIRKAVRIESQAIGFMSTKAVSEPSMLLGGLAKDAKSAADLTKRGADFVLLAKAAPGDAKDAGGAIAGAIIEGEADAKAYREGGFDFVVFDPDKTSSTAVLDDAIGYVMLLPKDATDVDLRSIESFQLDAIDVGEIKGSLTVRRQIELRRVFGLTRKPLLAAVPADITVPALQALRDTNVIGIIVEGGDAVERLRKTIDALPPRTRRKDEDRPTPLVPRTTAGDGDIDDDDHDAL
jgi:hypothetical protein